MLCFADDQQGDHETVAAAPSVICHFFKIKEQMENILNRGVKRLIASKIKSYINNNILIYIYIYIYIYISTRIYFSYL